MDTPLEQSISELSFYLFERPLHPELFNIYGSRHFFQGDYEVIIWITGCAHVVSVFSNGTCITECICPPEQLLPQHGLAQRFPFRGEKTHRCSWSNRLAYMMSFQVENMSANLYQATHDDLTNMAKKRGMLVSYPQWSRGGQAPFSYIDYEARQRELQLHTFHAFPEQQTIIKSQSIFEIPTH